MNMTLAIISLYLIIWIRICFKNNNIQWLSTSVILWLAFMLTAKQLLANGYDLFSPISLYHVYFFICLGSLPWCFHSLCYAHKSKQIYSKDTGYLQLAFVSGNLLLHFSLVFMSLIVYLWYPPALQSIFLLSFLEQYFLLPIWIIGLHLTLTSLLWMVGKLNKQPRLSLSIPLLIMLFCWSGFAFIAYTVLGFYQTYQ